MHVLSCNINNRTFRSSNTTFNPHMSFCICLGPTYLINVKYIYTKHKWRPVACYSVIPNVAYTRAYGDIGKNSMIVQMLTSSDCVNTSTTWNLPFEDSHAQTRTLPLQNRYKSKSKSSKSSVKSVRWNCLCNQWSLGLCCYHMARSLAPFSVWTSIRIRVFFLA